MERHKTRRALELSKAIPGGLLVLVGFTLLVMEWPRLVVFCVMGVGSMLVTVARMSQACVTCRRSMKRREYAFSPWIATQIREAVQSNDGAALAEIIRGPRIDNRMPTRTTLVLGYCDRCRRVTTVQTELITEGRQPRVFTDQEMVGPEVEPVAQAGIDVMP